jgi:hypothetical protein
LFIPLYVCDAMRLNVRLQSFYLISICTNKNI